MTAGSGVAKVTWGSTSEGASTSVGVSWSSDQNVRQFHGVIWNTHNFNYPGAVALPSGSEVIRMIVDIRVLRIDCYTCRKEEKVSEP